MATTSGLPDHRHDPEKHHRRSIRLRGYDYSQPGVYFVTICVQDRQCLFGEIVESEMRLNDAGCMVQTAWEELSRQYQGVDTDEFVVMPNHVHGIIVLVGADPRVCPSLGQPQRLSLPPVVQRFKTLPTK